LDSVTVEDWGEEIFAEGVGVKLKKWARGQGSPYPASASTLYQSSIQLQSKMAASNRFI